MSASRLALVSVLLVALAGLASPVHGAVEAEEDRQGAMVTVNVENRADTDAHVYALQDGHMVPIGFVEAGGNATLTVPSAAVESGEGIQLVADAVASPEWYQSDPVPIEPEDEVDFTIASDLENSTVEVRD